MTIERWQGMFRNVPYHLDKSLYKSGRRAFFFEYPLRDDADSEDIGRKQPRFQLEMFVIGADYQKARQLLLDALEASGPGVLVHPWWGSFRVQVGEISVTETLDELGHAGFSVEFFVVPGLVAANAPILVPAVVVNDSAQLLDDVAQAAFTEGWNVRGPIALVSLAAAGVQSMLDTVQAIQGRFDAINQVTDQLREIGQKVTSLVLTPANLGLQLVSALHTITETQFNPLGALKTQLQILHAVARPRESDAGATAVQRQADTNDGALSVLVRATVLADACRLMSGSVDRPLVTSTATSIPGVSFETREQALAMRDALLEQADALLADAPDEVFGAVMDLTGMLLQAMAQIMPTATLQTVELTGPLPAAVVAYRYTGAAAGVDDIVSRNKLRHPLFVPAGEPIEVLHG